MGLACRTHVATLVQGLLGALPSPATSATTAALAAAAAATVGVGASGSRRPPIIGFPRLPTPLAALVVALDIPAALAPAVPVALATAAHVLAAPLVAVAIAVSHAPRQGGIERQRMLPPPPPSTSPSPSPPPPPSPSPPSPSPSPPPPSPSRCRHWFPRSATMHEQRELPPLLPASADYAERYRGGYRAWTPVEVPPLQSYLQVTGRAFAKFTKCLLTQPPSPGISPATPPESARCGRRPPELTVRTFPTVAPPPAARARN
ncbi:hypothetical protein K525DRAFT_273640 [Schizophyllum commune Loenen D]|nr:hypothetical protein K525DRAFT_273640 [Schizophyllum commune Loenen D]